MNNHVGIQPEQAFSYWKSRLLKYKKAYTEIEKIYSPPDSLLSPEFSSAYLEDRIDCAYERDMSLLARFIIERDGRFNCLPLMLYILEKGYATFPHFLDEQRRPDINSSACISVVHAGGAYIAYLFQRPNEEINSLMFGGTYGMILATSTIAPNQSKINWFGEEDQGPRSLQPQCEAVQKLNDYIVSNREPLLRFLAYSQYSSLPPVCLVAHYNSLGHYIWNELPLVALVNHLPEPLCIGVGEYDFADIFSIGSSSATEMLTTLEMNGVHSALSEKHIFISPRPLIVLKDVFGIGHQAVKSKIYKHLDKCPCPNGALSSHIEIARDNIVVVIGLRIVGARRFRSTPQLVSIIDSVFSELGLNAYYYFDGFSSLPQRPSKNNLPSTTEGSAVSGLLSDLPESIRSKCLPYQVPTLAEKRKLLNSTICGFFPIGSSAIFQGWLTNIPAYYFDDGRYTNQFVEQDYLCNSHKNNCQFLDPSLFAPCEDAEGFLIHNENSLKAFIFAEMTKIFDSANLT
jgi:hypothetical protein